MTTQILRPVATVTVIDENDDELVVVADEARLTVDSGAVPYGSADITVPLVAVDTIEVIDPREDVRAVVAAGEDGEAPRVFDLGVRSREVDHRAKRIRIRLATDEALLQDYAPLTDDTTPFDLAASLRAVVDYVLGTVIPGAALAPGADADVTPYWPLTNFITNPRAESTTGFAAGGNVSTWGLDTTTGAAVGSNYVWWRSSGAGWSDMYLPGEATASEGESWTAQASVRSDISGHSMRMVVHFLDVNGAICGEVLGSVVAAPAAPGWVQAHATGTAPAGTVKVRAAVTHLATGAYQAVGVDAPALIRYHRPQPHFYGGATVGGYVCTWQGDADGSASEREPVIERDPELFTWPAGVSAWEFLQPLTAVAGLRLYCDETRAWRLIDPAEFTSPGRVTLSPLNSTEGVDEISRENADIYCTGVVVKYSWTDPTGTAKTATDTAGTAGRVFIVELNRPYPGPGVAAAILARRQGQGRTQDVTALAVWAAQPGQEASISLPGTVEQIGRVASVEWELPAGLMRVGTTGLVDVPPEAWLALDPGESWLDSPIGETWTGEVVA